MKTLFLGGTIYSPVPEATALLIEEEHIVWVGDDAAAKVYLDADTTIVELNGAFVAPPFIDSAYLGSGPSEDQDASMSGCSFAIKLGSTSDDSEITVGSTTRLRIEAELSDDELDTLVERQSTTGTSFVAVVDPACAKTAAALARLGIPFSLGSWGKYTTPWDWVRLATGNEEAPGISERAAFLAATRGPLRVFPELGWRTQGVLDGGTLADFAIWEAGEIDVRAADQRIANWSTDPRSGVPGLPHVQDPHKVPTLRTRYSRGKEATNADVIDLGTHVETI